VETVVAYFKHIIPACLKEMERTITG